MKLELTGKSGLRRNPDMMDDLLGKFSSCEHRLVDLPRVPVSITDFI